MFLHVGFLCTFINRALATAAKIDSPIFARVLLDERIFGATGLKSINGRSARDIGILSDNSEVRHLFEPLGALLGLYRVLPGYR